MPTSFRILAGPARESKKTTLFHSHGGPVAQRTGQVSGLAWQLSLFLTWAQTVLTPKTILQECAYYHEPKSKQPMGSVAPFQRHNEKETGMDKIEFTIVHRTAAHTGLFTLHLNMCSAMSVIYLAEA
uniref:Uncharacterized protein n=1 Tax=Molossus molossus TaxID=27622 RepID=A0A7J8FRU6_MOLMO|nr:hypothetical protein HJG59_008367 [Molossus molossus]